MLSRKNNSKRMCSNPNYCTVGNSYVCRQVQNTEWIIAEVRIKSWNLWSIYFCFYVYSFRFHRWFTYCFSFWKTVSFSLCVMFLNNPHTDKDCNLHLCRIGERSNTACNGRRFPTNFLSLSPSFEYYLHFVLPIISRIKKWSARKSYHRRTIDKH